MRATHYVADTYGYRIVEPQKPLITYPNRTKTDSLIGTSNSLTSDVNNNGVLLQWDQLYFPIGCGKFEGGFRSDIPLLFVDDVRYIIGFIIQIALFIFNITLVVAIVLLFAIILLMFYINMFDKYSAMIKKI